MIREIIKYNIITMSKIYGVLLKISVVISIIYDFSYLIALLYSHQGFQRFSIFSLYDNAAVQLHGYLH